MSDKPSYLGLLNAISVAEGCAQRYFAAWETMTKDAELRQALHLVTVREGEHALSFEKRLIELGFSVRDLPDPEVEARAAIVRDPARSDIEKLEALGYGEPDTVPDLFDGMFKNHTIDIETGALLGRYIAEERDTGRRMRAQYARLKSAQRSKVQPGKAQPGKRRSAA